MSIKCYIKGAMRTIRPFAMFMIFFSVLLIAHECHRFIAIDDCLDRGGAWIYSKNYCSFNETEILMENNNLKWYEKLL